MVDDNRLAGAEDDTDEALKAFAALRKAIDKRGSATTAELKTIRKGVEALFEQVEALQVKPDYAEDLAQLKKIGVVVAERLKALEATPVLKHGVAAFERAGTELIKTSAQALDQRAQRLDSAAFHLEQITQAFRDRNRHLWHLAIAVVFSLLLGGTLLIFIPRLLPFSADSNVAAWIMGKARWDAGAAIMRATDPTGWKAVTDNAQLGADNAEVLARCRQAAAKSGQAQRCVVKIGPSAQR